MLKQFFSFVRKSFSIKCIFFALGFSLIPVVGSQAQIVWSEDFTLPDGTIVDATPPSQWSIDVTAATMVPPNDYFEVRSNAMSARDVDGEVIWISESITISGSGNVVINFDIFESGNLETTDYVRGYYILDGGPEVLFGEHLEDIRPNGGTLILSSSVLSGTSLQILIKVFNDGGQEIFNIDNVQVSTVSDLISIGSGNWDDPTNWSMTGALPACGCTPNTATNVTIQAGSTVDINTAANALNLLVESGATLRWVSGGGDLDLNGTTSLVVQSGGAIDRNGFTASRIDIVSGTILSVVIDDATTGIDVETFGILSSGNNITFSGSGIFYTNDDFVISGNNNSIINNLTGTFTINDQLHFNGTGISNQFQNNETLIVNDDIRFNNDDCTFINNGTATLTDDFLVSGTGDTNNSVTNNASSVITFDQLRLGNADGFSMVNFGTINQLRQFVTNTIPTINSFTNRENATWNFGGLNFDTDVQIFTNYSNNIFVYNRAGNQGVIVPQDNYWNLSLTGSGNKTLSGSIDIDGDLSNGATLVMNTDGINLAGNFINTSILDAGTSTTILDGPDQDITMGGQAFNNLDVSGSGVKMLQDPMDINGNLTLNSTMDVSTSNYQLNIGGNFTNNGTFIRQQGEVILDGTGDQTMDGSISYMRFTDLTFNKIGGQVYLEDSIEFNGTLRIPQAITVNANGVGGLGMLILNSVPGIDGRVDILPAGTIVSGSVMFKRYIPNTAGDRFWRYVGSPIQNATVEQIQQQIPITGTFNDPSTVAQWPQFPDIDESSPSLYYYDETLPGTFGDRYVNFPGTGVNAADATFTVARGYAMYFRQITPLTMVLVGTANPNMVSIDVTSSGPSGPADDNGWNLIANPYPSVIDWDLVTKPAGVNDAIYFRDNANNFGQGLGAVISYVGGVGIPPTFGGEIPLVQAFWVRATANATITFEQDDKIPGNYQFARTKPVPNLLRLIVKNESEQSEAAIRFTPEATDEFDKRFDATLFKSGISVSSVIKDGNLISINSLSSDFCYKEVPLALNIPKSGEYELEFYNLESFRSSMRITLEDLAEQVSFDISNGNNYVFQIDIADVGLISDRFKLIFDKQISQDIELDFQSMVCENEEHTIRLSLPQNNTGYALIMEGIGISDTLSASEVIEFDYDVSSLQEGINTISVVAFNSICGLEGLVQEINISKSLLPSSPSIINEYACESGSLVLLKASGGSDGNYRWYEQFDSSESIPEMVNDSFETQVTSDSKTFWVSIINDSGCESERVEIIANLIQLSSPEITHESESKLVSTALENNQWFLDGVAIEGATAPTYEPEKSGSYTVVVSNEGCQAESTPYIYLVTSIKSLTEQSDIIIYPNPVTNQLKFELKMDPNWINGDQIEVIDTQGRLQASFDLKQGKYSYSFNIEQIPNGVYLLRLKTEKNQQYLQRFIKY